MKRVDAAGATADKKFTLGNPSLGIPATTVDDSIMNALVEEVVAVVVATGQTLSQDNTDLTQLLKAVKGLITTGGGQKKFTIVNNTALATDVTDALFGSANFKAVMIDFDLHRQSDTGGSEVDEIGTIYLTYDAVNSVWKISQTTAVDDSAVVFSITAAGQLQYTSSNIAGTNSTGTMRYTAKTFAA